ncbi:hypothetical protein EJ110_NYTH07309 [Nymphaea thermarum]|nr:hypothetical protein EJ110_NYTH07309 [Nymphaea thermarum]
MRHIANSSMVSLRPCRPPTLSPRPCRPPTLAFRTKIIRGPFPSCFFLPVLVTFNVILEQARENMRAASRRFRLVTILFVSNTKNTPHVPYQLSFLS